ncbi:MAG: four helix bundle suffix domain-containing protein [Candidatus Amulumruptor sp.]|nr:four helix bundle suffix domain-containing protein [Candidatus Amulumruptor sp.]MDE6545077.1 four helix bundle suffix domain-containing protein [Paramuribaculum sp.]MDE7150925.1 four helix bundle suffix domain-containing protein [Candidatus Amulumruptor sp.]MDE7237980.1 four helix bundle suffix domain-containing protein [Paramuribaculum sp.]
MKPFLPKSSGYRKLKVYRITEIICDLTAFFAKTRIRPGSRTRDQMEQAARSGKQNIAEGSAASATSKETEIKLTNVAKASLEELELDYDDYLRQHDLTKWSVDHPRSAPLRRYLMSDDFMNNPMKMVRLLNDEEYCNLCITLISQAKKMLQRLLESQQRQFLEHGGIRELMYRARTEARQHPDTND